MTFRTPPISNKQSTETSDILARSTVINLPTPTLRDTRKGRLDIRTRRSTFDWLIEAAIEFSMRTENAQQCVELAQRYIGNRNLSAKRECFMAGLSGWFIKPIFMYPNQRLPRRKAHYAFCVAAFNYVFRREQARWSFAHFNKLRAEDKADHIFADKFPYADLNGETTRKGDGDVYFNKELSRIAINLATKNHSIIKRKFLKGMTK